MKKASETYLKDILEYTTDEVVFQRLIHCKSSSIFDAGLRHRVEQPLLSSWVSWYDKRVGLQ